MHVPLYPSHLPTSIHIFSPTHHCVIQSRLDWFFFLYYMNRSNTIWLYTHCDFFGWKCQVVGLNPLDKIHFSLFSFGSSSIKLAPCNKVTAAAVFQNILQVPFSLSKCKLQKIRNQPFLLKVLQSTGNPSSKNDFSWKN